jgi:hypothetical protein
MIGPVDHAEIVDDPPALLSERAVQPTTGARLPDEWVLRDLPRLDLDDPATYVSLWETYGPLVDLGLCPLPSGLFPNSVWSDEWPLGLQHDFGDETSQREAQDALDKLVGRTTEREPIPWHVSAVSVKLLRHHFEVLRALADHIWAHQQKRPLARAWKTVALQASIQKADEAWRIWINVINGAMRPFSLHVGPRVLDEAPPLYAVAALQIFNLYVEGLQVLTCANENCQRRFQRQLGRAPKGQYRTSGVMFCTHQCADAQRQRDRRRAKWKGQ